MQGLFRIVVGHKNKMELEFIKHILRLKQYNILMLNSVARAI